VAETATGGASRQAQGPDATVVGLVLDVGEGLLSAGAETERVEDTAVRIANAYGDRDVDAFAVPTGLFVSFAGGRATGMRRVRNRGMDLGRLADWNDLARRVCEERPPAATGADWVRQVTARGEPYPAWAAPVMAAAGNAAFTYLVGGRATEAALAALSGVVVQAAVRGVGSHFTRRFFHAAAGGFAAVLIAAAGAHVLPGVRPVMVVTGGIVLLLPGLALTAAVRDMLTGDFLAGAARSLEALVTAAALAAGVALASSLLLSHVLGGGPL